MPWQLFVSLPALPAHSHLWPLPFHTSFLNLLMGQLSDRCYVSTPPASHENRCSVMSGNRSLYRARSNYYGHTEGCSARRRVWEPRLAELIQGNRDLPVNELMAAIRA